MDNINKLYKRLNKKKPSNVFFSKTKRNLFITAAVFFIMSTLVSITMVLFSLIYIIYNMFYNKENFKPSVNSEAEDERIEKYYINSDVHRDQKLLLEQFLDFLC